jgi:hypothetical protein
MSVDPIVVRWQSAIITSCEKALGRHLTPPEIDFIKSRGALIALEMVEDTVRDFATDRVALERYLNSEGGRCHTT